jgi:hypothetical protein
VATGWKNILITTRGLHCAVTPRNTPIEDILAAAEKAVQFLPVEMMEEARQETVRIKKSSYKSTDNLTRAEQEALQNLKKNTDLTILRADKGNATVILNNMDYKRKITSLLEDPSYKRFARDPTKLTE